MDGKIPQVESANFLGTLKTYVKDPLSYLQTNQKKYGDIFRFQVANRALIFVNHPDYVKRILQENHRNYKKSQAYQKLALLLGDGLFTSEGDYWRKQRRIIQPAFHRNEIKSYAHIMQEFSMEMIDKWKQLEQVSLTSEMTAITLQIISKAMLDVKLDHATKTVEEHLPFALSYMVNRITSPLAAPLWLPTSSNRRFKRSRKTLDTVIYDIIKHKKIHLGIDLLSQLITLKDEDTGEGMTDLQLRDEVMTIFLAGHETTAMGLTWFIHSVLKDDNWKRILLKEIKGLRNPWDGIQNYTIQKMISEVLRLRAPVWILSRLAVGPDQLGDYDIHEGDRIIFSPYMIHRHPEFWNDPDKFDPTRFDGNARHKFSYFPFGVGPRICIGEHFALMEMTIILVNLFKNFPEMKLHKVEEPGYDYSITLRPDREILIDL